MGSLEWKMDDDASTKVVKTADALYKLYGPESAVVVMLGFQDPDKPGHDQKRWAWRGGCLAVEGMLLSQDMKPTEFLTENGVSESFDHLAESFAMKATVIVMVGGDFSDKQHRDMIVVGKPLRVRGLRTRCTSEILSTLWTYPPAPK